MKRYVSAILIPALLLQLFGCYSWRIVETPEPGSHIKIFTNNNKVIEPKNWRYDNGNFVGDMGEEKLEGYTAVKLESTIERKEINKIEEEYLNEGRTGILLSSFFFVVIYAIISIKNSLMSN